MTDRIYRCGLDSLPCQRLLVQLNYPRSITDPGLNHGPIRVIILRAAPAADLTAGKTLFHLFSGCN